LTCGVCGGTGFEIVSHEGREAARPCACRRGERRSEDDFYSTCRIPPRYEHCSLANFEPHSAVHKAALERAMLYCSGYPFLGKSEGLGLLFTGSNGVGKTHLAVAVMRELVLTKGVTAQFWDFQELMREIRKAYDPETRLTEFQVLAPVIEMDVLLIDDLGAWRITDWMNDTLFHIINKRYVARLATIITTNFFDVPAAEAREAGDSYKREFLVERIGERLRSRLSEMCLHVPLHGEDFRQRQQAANRHVVLGTHTDAEPPATPRRPKPLFGGD
jgi:DNA replication protein DnaC